jgi:hypothetical protein
MPCKFPAGHPDENNNFGNAEVCSRYGGVWLDLPDSPASNERLDLLSNFTGTGLLSKAIPRIGAKGVPNITGQPRTIQQVQKAPQSVVKPEPLIASRPPPTTGLFNKTAEKAGQFARQHPVVTAATVASPALSLMGEGPVTDKRVVQQGVPASPLMTREQLEKRNIALNQAMQAGDTAAADAILKTGSAVQATPVPPKPTDKPNVFNGGEPTGEEIKSVAKGKDIPDSIWDKMKTKEYWMTGMEGGSGDWDNRLFRLGEMMSYMGTPLSKRGKNPAERWTMANTESDKIKAAIEKERIKATGKGDDLKSLTFPQFQGNFAKNFESFKENGWIPFDDYSEEEMSNIMNKAWLVHQKQPKATLESILKALKDNKQI